MIQLVEYQPEHYDAIYDAVEPFSSIENNVDVKSGGVAITGIDGDVMACGGIVYTSDTEGLVWVRVSKRCRKDAFMWARTIRETFRIMVESTGLNVFTYVVDGFPEGDRLARSIGLQKTDESGECNGKLYYKYTVAK